jgi:hypothetical protein
VRHLGVPHRFKQDYDGAENASANSNMRTRYHKAMPVSPSDGRTTPPQTAWIRSSLLATRSRLRKMYLRRSFGGMMFWFGL